MSLLRYLASLFINLFGITQPSTEARDRAARYIAFLLLAMVVGLVLVFLSARYLLNQ